MKKVLLKLVMFLLPVAMMAQNSAVDRLFEKYSGKEGYTSVVISSKMFSMFSEMGTSDEDFDNLVRGLTGIKILATDDGYEGKGRVNFYKEIIDELPLDKYEELMVVREKDQDVKFLIREEGDVIVELLLIVGGSEDNALISIQGIIDLKTISKLSQSMDIEGLDKLEDIDRKKK
jgi:hypothetical protein